MMETITGLMETYGERAVLLIPLLAFAEACVGIGIFVSGAFLLLLCAYLYTNGLVSPELILLLAMAGAIVGDHVGFYFGVWVGPSIHHAKWAERYKDRLQSAEALVRRYGSFAIFIGRFIPAIRSLVPAILGVSEFGRRRYSLLDMGACFLWAIALVLIVRGIDLAL